MEQQNFGNSKGYQVIADRIGHVGNRYESYEVREIFVAGICDLPLKIQTDWVPRETAQAKVRERLKQRPVTEIVAVGGFGKSWLAAWAYHEFEGSYDQRLWVKFSEERWQEAFSFDRFARGILQEIGRPLKDPKISPKHLLSELIYRLSEPNNPRKVLIVMDNMESLRQTDDWTLFQKFLTDFEAEGLFSRVLVTTKLEAVTESPILLEGLTVKEGIAFLQRQRLIGNQLDALVHLTEGHPLLLKLAATWVRETEESEVDEQTITFFRRLFEGYEPKGGERIETNVELVFEKVFTALPEYLQTLLKQVSVYRIPFGLEMAQAMGETIRIEDLQDLVRRALLVAEGEKFTLHPLIVALVKKKLLIELQLQSHIQAQGYYQFNYQPWDGTIASCQEGLEAFHHAFKLGWYSTAYEFLRHRAGLLQQIGYRRELLQLYRMLAESWQTNSDEVESRALIEIWNSLGNLSRSLNDYLPAASAHRKAQEISRHLPCRKGEAISLNGLGLVYHDLAQYEEATDFYQQSRDISCEIGDRLGEADSLGNLGLIYDVRGQYREAISSHQRSLILHSEIGDRLGEANDLGNLGLAHHALGKHRQAIGFHRQSLAIKREIGNRNGEATSLNSLGLAYHALGEYQQAIDFHRQSLAIKREIGNRSGTANSMGNLGNAFYDLGQYQKARDLYQQSLAISSEIGDRRNSIYALNGLGLVYRSSGFPKKAIDSHQESITIAHEIGDYKGEANSHWSLSILYQWRGQLKHAMHHRHQAYQLWREMQLPLAATPLHNLLNLVHRYLGNDWAEELLNSERKITWLYLSLGYLFFILRTFLSPLIYFQKSIRINPLLFWFTIGISLSLLIAWLL